MFEPNTNYPVVLVPGVLGYGDQSFATKVLPYFGMTAGSVEKTIKSLNMDCFTATFGALSGIWDRACELYAQIKGGTVDYGKAHSEKYGTSRFGRTYEGFCPNFGEGEDNKVTLIAHGFGVPVARLLIYLMANGSKKEQAAGGKDMSDLFAGGHTTAVHALVSLAGINDGTTFLQALEYRLPGTYRALTIGGLAYSQIDSLLHGGILKNHSVTSRHGNLLKLDFQKAGSFKDKLGLNESAVDGYLANTRDNLFWELTTDGMAEFNKCVRINPETYYIAYTGEVTRDYGELLPERKVLGKHDTVMVARDTSRPSFVLPDRSAGLLAPAAALMCTFKNYLPDAPLVTPAMAPNDGMVNTDFSLAPTTEEALGFQSAEACEPGVWYQMPVEAKNHLRFLGLGVRPDTYRNEIYDMMAIIAKLPKY